MGAKIVQIERNTKGKLVFLCISEMQPIFDRRSKIVKAEQKIQILFEVYRKMTIFAAEFIRKRLIWKK